MFLQNFGGQARCIMGDVQMANVVVTKLIIKLFFIS